MSDAESPKTMVVTGGSGGLGSAIARRFAARGARVFFTYLGGESRAKALVEEITADGGQVTAVPMDLTDPASVEAGFATVLSTVPTVDILINNAAYRPIGAFLDLTDDDWSRVLETNVMGAVRTIRAVLPGMRRAGYGRILNVSGLDALWGFGNRAHVTVSKTGLMGLTRAVAVETADEGITVNTVVPGSFRTPRDPASYPDWERMRRYLVSETPVGRQGEPVELADLCWWLSSPEAGYITGQDIHINGGAYPLKRNPLLSGSPDGL